MIDTIFSWLFTSYREYIEFKALRDTILAIEPILENPKYLSTLDIEEEQNIDKAVLI